MSELENEREVLQMIRRDYPFINLDKTRALIRLTLNTKGDALAERPHTMDVQLNTQWCVHRNGHNMTIRESEMYFPEHWALAVEWQAYADRLAADVRRQEREIENLKNRCSPKM